MVPPYHLTNIFKLCKTCFYELKVIVLMKEKLFYHCQIVSSQLDIKFVIFKKSVKNWWGPVVPPYHLTNILKLCKTCFYELKVTDLMKEKLFHHFQIVSSQLQVKFVIFKNRSKTGGVLWSPLTISPKYDACGPALPFHQNLMPVAPPYHFTKI